MDKTISSKDVDVKIIDKETHEIIASITSVRVVDIKINSMEMIQNE